MPALLRRHRAAGPGTATWLPARFSPAGGCETRSPRQTREQGKWGCDPRLTRPRPRSQPACRSRGPELRPPPARPAASSLLLARSLPPPGGLGADSAARCSRGWKMAGNDCSALLDEELSSFFLNYLSDTQVRASWERRPGTRVQSRGAAAAAAEAGAQRWAHRGDRGVQAAEPPFHVPCAALRYRRSELQVAGACCSIGGHSHPGGSGQGYLESTVPPPAKLRGTAIPWAGGIWPGSEGPLRLALGAVGASSAPSTCCRTFTCTCGGGKGGGPQPWSPLVLQHRVPQVLPLVFPQPPTCSRSAEFPVTCRLGELRGLRGTWTCGRR